MARIVVTGGSGKAGRGVVRDLLERGHDVLNVDLVAPAEPAGTFVRADVTDLGQTIEALGGADAVVHLAAIPSPTHAAPEVTFRTNVVSTQCVFVAAARCGVRRVVWASSETVLGLPFDRPPDYAPLDEAHVFPESAYALSKVLGEEMARHFHRWTGMAVLGLRFSQVTTRDEYAAFPAAWDDPHARKSNLWSYVDESDVAQAVRLALGSDVDGAETFIIAAADTAMARPTRELMAEVFPTVALAGHIGGHASLLSCEKARAVLGYEPGFTWRDVV
jgi:nucleoside-diphosphate-sugar epimerase